MRDGSFPPPWPVEGYWFAPDRLSDPAHRWLFGRLDAVREELAAAL